MARTPSPERIATLVLLTAEEAFLRQRANGQYRVPADLVWALDRWAVLVPDVAARLPMVRAALSPEVRAAISAQVSAPPGSEFDIEPPHQAPSMMSARVAADLLGITDRAVRYAAAKGSLTGTKHADGEWRIRRTDVEAYARGRGNREVHQP